MSRNSVIIGLDVPAYAITGGGQIDSAGFVAGASYSMVGRWETVELTFMRKLFETTSSDGKSIERRSGPYDWKASCSNLTRLVGNVALPLGMNNIFIQLSFADGSGFVYTVTGMFDTASGTYNQEKANEKLDIVGCGLPNDFLYQ